jgi:hypothetical protein
MSSDVKQTSVDGILAPDPLRYKVALPIQRVLHPLGFPVRIETNNAAILAVAEQNWGASEPRFSTPAVTVRVAVSDAARTAFPPVPEYRAQGHLLAIVSDAGNFAMCDLSTGFAFCWLTPDVVASQVWMRHYFLDAMVYCALTNLYVTAVHAACIAKNGRGILLCARSGVGKSVLALASARKGWTFVADDVVYVRRDIDNAEVLGRPDRLKLLPSALAIFPEARTFACGPDQNGAPFIEVVTTDLGLATARECRIESLIFLKRPAPLQLAPVNAGDAFVRLIADIPLFEESVHQAHRRSIRMLSQLRAFELGYDSLDDAVGILDELAGGS